MFYDINEQIYAHEDYYLPEHGATDGNEKTTIRYNAKALGTFHSSTHNLTSITDIAIGTGFKELAEKVKSLVPLNRDHTCLMAYKEAYINALTDVVPHEGVNHDEVCG